MKIFYLSDKLVIKKRYAKKIVIKLSFSHKQTIQLHIEKKEKLFGSLIMDPSGGRDARYNLNYSMSIGLSMTENPDMYGNPNPSLGRPPSGLGPPVMNRGNGGNGGGGGGVSGLMGQNSQCNNLSNSRGIKRTSSDCYDDRAIGSQSLSALDGCGGVPDVGDDGFTSLQKKSPPANGKKTKGRVKIKMEYIDNKLRRYTTFSKRKTGIMKKVSKV